MIGVAFTFWLTLGWTEGYSEATRIFWIGPVGVIFEDSVG